MALLLQAYQNRKDTIVGRLISLGYVKSEDGRQLYELPLSELENRYIELKGVGIKSK